MRKISIIKFRSQKPEVRSQKFKIFYLLPFLPLYLLTLLPITLFSQTDYSRDRVYTGNQVSNTVSVIDPSTNTLLGEIVLGKAQPNILTALYKGQSLVHGLGYSPVKKMLAVVAIGSNAIILVKTETNEVLKTIYVGRSPHEATFSPDGSQIWVTVRGEAYISVIDSKKMEEIKQVPVSDGPGMVAFSKDGKLAYVCSSFSPFVDIINTKTYKLVKKLEMPSPFSPNIFTNPDGTLLALTLKDIGKVVVIDAKTNEICKVFPTGPITNHVSFANYNGKKIMQVTVGGENCVKFYDIADDYKQIAKIDVGQLPHGLWGSPDGKKLYVGLEYADQVQPIDLETMKALTAIQIGQSPQALLYAKDAVVKGDGKQNLKPLVEATPTQTITMQNIAAPEKARGELAVRTIGLADLVEQLFLNLKPNTAYILGLSKSEIAPYSIDYEINSFVTDEKGKFAGQSTGLVKNKLAPNATTGHAPLPEHKKVVLVEVATRNVVMIGE